MPTAQDNITTDLLDKFHRPLSINIVKKSRDWQFRQKMGYESMKGLMQKDWMSVSDWKEQISLYSKSLILLSGPISAITPLLVLNRKLLTSLFIDKIKGKVGKFLQTMQGFDTAFVLSPETLNDEEALDERLSS